MDRRSSSSTARPPTTRRSGRSARCSGRRTTCMPWTGAAGATRATRSPTRSSASSRTSRPSPTRWPTDRRGPIDLVGHSYGGRTALGAALLTDAVGRVVCYEGAPTPPGASYHPPGIEDRLRERLDAGDSRWRPRPVLRRGRRDVRRGAGGLPGEPDLAGPGGGRGDDPARARGRSWSRRPRWKRSASSDSRSSRSSAPPACPSSTRRPKPWTRASRTVASPASTGPAMPPTTPTRMPSSPPSEAS